MSENDFYIKDGELISYTGTSSTVQVPDGVTTIGEDAFFECAQIQGIVLAKGVRTIGKRAFWGCASLSSIVLPDTLCSIEDNAFRSCISLRQISIPYSVTHLGDAVFRDCEQLSQADLPDTLTRLGLSTFSNCYNLRSIKLPRDLESIGSSCFHWCIHLSQIDIPQHISVLDSQTFSGCSDLQRVKLPQNLKTIGVDCFNGCTRLMELEVPDSVGHIGSNAFYKSGLMNNCRDDFLILGRILVKYVGSSETVEVPRNVNVVGDYAFAFCEQLRSVVLPETVEYLGSYAFERCTKLESVILPQDLKTIGTGAFSDCTSLSTLQLPPSLERIGAKLFENSGVEIGEEKGMTVAAGKYLLEYSGSAEKLILPGTVEVIADEAFVASAGINEIILPQGVRTIGSAAFRWRSELKKVTVPESVSYIGENAFANCYGLQIVLDAPSGFLGDNAFPGGTELDFTVLGQPISITLEKAVKQGDLSLRQLWSFVCGPDEQTFDALEKLDYKIPCAIALYNCAQCYSSFLKEHITQAVCYASGKQSIPLLEKVLSYGLLDLEQLTDCIDNAVQNKLTDQQVILMRYRHEHFDQTDAVASRFDF